MKHKIVVDGVGYRIRPVTLDDAQFIIDVRFEDFDRNRFINNISAALDEQKNWLSNYFEKIGDYYFIIENKITGESEGLIGIYDELESRAEWGRWVLKKGSFAASESVDLVCKAAFNNLSLNEIYCKTIEDNIQVVSFHDGLPFNRRESNNPPNTLFVNGTEYRYVEHFCSARHYFEVIQNNLENKALKIFQRNFKAKFGKLEFHHIGVATNNIEKEYGAYRILGYKREDISFEDHAQGIKGLFITAEGQPRLELLENLAGSTTLDYWLKNRVKMYHFGYKTEKIEEVVKVFNKNRIKIIADLKVSTYFKKRICFLILSNSFMIELIEA